MNLYEQQAANRRTTVLVIAVFIAFFAFLGLGFDFFFFGFNPWAAPVRPVLPLDYLLQRHRLSFPLATTVAILISSFSAWMGFIAGDRAVLASSMAVRIEPSMVDEKYRQLMDVVEEMAVASGLPMPQVYIVTDDDPNAFATGRDPQHASIAVTTALIEKLNREELQSVIAHEMSHVRNYDTRLMTILAALVGGSALLANWASRSMWYGGGRSSSSDRKSEGSIIAFVLWLIAVMLAPILAQVLAMAVSRQREYLADASGAELTRNPAALASALRKIDAQATPTPLLKQRGTAHLCIADPMEGSLGDREGFLADLLATHPPIQKRIERLTGMAYRESSLTPKPRAQAKTVSGML